jgi:hypothetical protein
MENFRQAGVKIAKKQQERAERGGAHSKPVEMGLRTG